MSENLYISNRKKILNSLDNNSVVILFAGKDICKSADEAYEFTVNRNFYYLTGINEQNDILVLQKDNNHIFEKIFINKYDEFLAKWVGRKLLADEVKDISGVEEIDYLDKFEDYLNQLINKQYSFYLDLPTPLFSEPQGEEKKLETKLKVQNLEVKSCHEILATARMEKSEFEVDKIKKAIDITNEGIKALMTNIAPNMLESQVESYFDQQIKYHGASGFAFKTIAASGGNACVLHYSTNNTVIKDNELVLFDLGAEFDLYKADITRTFPANGKFTSRQKQIYNIVLEGQKVVMDAIKPGLTTKDLNNILIKFYMTELKKIGLIKTDNEVRNYYYHGVSHHLGLDTHDIALRDKPLTPGCIITVEPGLYIAEEGIGIRIEDDVLVTNEGCINLSSNIIKTVDEIEAFMLQNNKKTK